MLKSSSVINLDKTLVKSLYFIFRHNKGSVTALKKIFSDMSIMKTWIK